MKYHLYPDKRGRLRTQLYIRDYIHAGNGTCTLENPETHVSYKYIFLHPIQKESFERGTVFVNVLDDENIAHYIGKVDKYGNLHTTYRSLYSKQSPEYKGARYICDWAKKPHFHSRMHLYHEGVCAFCGRELKSPWTVQRGFHKHCYHVLFPHRFIPKETMMEDENNV